MAYALCTHKIYSPNEISLLALALLHHYSFESDPTHLFLLHFFFFFASPVSILFLFHTSAVPLSSLHRKKLPVNFIHFHNLSIRWQIDIDLYAACACNYFSHTFSCSISAHLAVDFSFSFNSNAVFSCFSLFLFFIIIYRFSIFAEAKQHGNILYIAVSMGFHSAYSLNAVF